jgi:cytochrome c oxidase cbb3-type subunit 1
MFFCAACWLVLASAFELIGSIKFHSPSFLAASAWLTYGRVHAAYLNCLIYGFCVQAGLGVCLWLLSRLGQTRLAEPWLVIVGTLCWNAGVKLGVCGILWGDGTGFEYLEMPGYAACIVMLGYLLIGLSGVLTFHQRSERQLFVSQWFILAALFWFPWIYATAELLLVAHPVRGAAQVAIWSFYNANLQVIWLALVGLAAIFYFLPRLTGRDLHSRYLALFAFWMLILFGGWTGIANGAPLPAWMPAINTVATMLLAVPLLAVGLNVFRTLRGKGSSSSANTPLRFLMVGAVALLLAWLLKMICAGVDMAFPVGLTWLVPAQAQLNLYGFFALVAFGAAYAILPRLTDGEFPFPRLVRLHFWLALLGVLLIVVPLAGAGIVEALKSRDPSTPFMGVAKSTLPFLRASTMGDLLLALGHLMFLVNVVGLAVRFYRPGVVSAYAGATSLLPRQRYESRPVDISCSVLCAGRLVVGVGAGAPVAGRPVTADQHS